MKSSIIQIDPDIQHGEPVFSNTRVPIKSLFDYISTGESLEAYLDDFPAVSKQKALAILKKAEHLFLQTYTLMCEESIT